VKKLILLALAAVVVAAGVGLVLGWPRVEVAKDKFIAQVDKLLGEIEVRRKEVQLAKADVERSVEELSRGKIALEVKVESLDRKANDVRKKLDDADAALAKLGPLLRQAQETKAAVSVGAATWSPTQLDKAARDVLSYRKRLETDLNNLKERQQLLGAAAGEVARRYQEANEKLESLNHRIVEIDDKVETLKALKATAQVVGESDQGLTERLADLEKKVESLDEQVATELKFDALKWQNVAPGKDDVEKLLGDVGKGPADTLAEIEKVLAAKK
jgi:chromosome segregation ATPase